VRQPRFHTLTAGLTHPSNRATHGSKTTYSTDSKSRRPFVTDAEQQEDSSVVPPSQ